MSEIKNEEKKLDPIILKKLPCNSCKIEKICKHSDSVLKFYDNIIELGEELSDIIKVNLKCDYKIENSIDGFGLRSHNRDIFPTELSESHNMNITSKTYTNGEISISNPSVTVSENNNFTCNNNIVSKNEVEPIIPTTKPEFIETEYKIPDNVKKTQLMSLYGIQKNRTDVNIDNSISSENKATASDEPIVLDNNMIKENIKKTFVEEILGDQTPRHLETSTIGGREIKGVTAQTEQGNYVNVTTMSRIRK